MAERFFEHRLRQDESYFNKESYISMNPVRAGLVSNPDKWKIFWIARENFE